MKAYASESYYIGVYLCGREPDISAAFDFYAMQATRLMKQYTLDNVLRAFYAFEYLVKYAFCRKS